MEAVIDGVRYDTENAVKIAEWTNGRSAVDYCYEAVYKVKADYTEYFLYGKGGAMSKYGRIVGECWAEGEKITPISVKSAHALVKARCPKQYEKIFGR